MTVVDTFSKREVRMEDFSRELESTKKNGRSRTENTVTEIKNSLDVLNRKFDKDEEK